MITFSLLLLFCIKIVCGKTEIPIGGIFHVDNREVEIAFRASIQRVNIHEKHLHYVPIIKYVSSTNSFKAEKAACELAMSGVAAIFGPHTLYTSGVVESICHHMKIPHFIAHWKPEPYRFINNVKNMTINLYPDSSTLARAFAEVVMDNEWKGYTIIYEKSEGLIKLKDVLGIHGPNDKSITVRKLGSERGNYALFKKVRESRSSDIILDCNLEDTMQILLQVKQMGLLGEYERMLLPALDTHTLDFQQNHLEGSNISSFRLFDPESLEVINAVNDWEQTEKRQDSTYRISPFNAKTESALMYDAVQIFADAFQECNTEQEIEMKSLNCKHNVEWEHGQRIIQRIKMKSADGITGPIMIDPDGQRNHFQLEIIELSKTLFKRIGFWLPSKGVISTRSEIEVEDIAKHSLQNKRISVVSRLDDPFLMKREGENLSGNDRWEGYSMDLIDAISKVLNFTYEFELVADDKYGNIDEETQEWNGIVRHVMDRKADVGICDLTITYERRTAVDFTMPFMTLGITILYTNPEKPPPNLFSFLSPLSTEVWIYTLSAYLAVVLLLLILARMAPEEWQNPHPCNHDSDETENIWNIKNCSWVNVGFLMGQGSDILPKAKSTRIICGMMWFFALIMLSSYTANLAAFLTNSQMVTTIENVDQLANQNTVKYGVYHFGSTFKFFKNSSSALYQKMFAAMENEEPSVFTESNQQGVDRVVRSKMKFAFFMESSILDYMLQQDCRLVKVGNPLDSKEYGIALPMNSPYRKEFNRAILQLQEHGKLDLIKKKWWKNKHTGESCSSQATKKSDTTELGVAHVGGVFIILLIGCLSGLLIGIMEFLWNVRKVAVEQKLTPWIAFKNELYFACQLNIGTKAVRKNVETPRSKSQTVPRSCTSKYSRYSSHSGHSH